jgi:hypothetical protein
MANILFEVTVLNGSIPVTLRMASAAATAAGCQLNNYAWTPLITKRHTVSGTWTDDGIFSRGEINNSSLTFRMSSAYENEIWSSYEWTGGLARIFVQTGAEGDFAAYKQVFEGSVSSLDREGVNATVALLGPDALLDRNLLSLEYQGTGGSEGDPSLKGRLKPRAFGRPQSVEPVLVNGARWIYQVHGYGAVNAISAVYEFAQPLDAIKNKGDVADYAALAAMTLVPGEWATCNSQGMFRLGATPKNKVSADVRCWGVNDVATITKSLLAEAGIPTARIGDLSAFTQTWSLYQTEQTTIGEQARAALAQAGGQLFADGTGTWQAMNFFASKTPIILNADRSTIPLVKSVREMFAEAPVWKVKIGYDRCWSVHSASEVSPALSDVSDKAQASQDAAAAASEAARLAAADASVAKDRVDAITNDGILDRSEKADIVLRFGNATAERTGLLNKGSEFVVTTERTAYSNAYNALKAYLEGLAPAYTDTTQNTAIDRSAFNDAWGGYHIARQNLLNAIDGKAGTLATWTGVSGDGKPQDNATVGAPIGTNIGDRPVADVLTGIDNANGLAGAANTAAAEAKASITLNTDSIVKGALRQADYQAVLDARTTLNGQPIGTVITDLKTQTTENNTALATTLALIGAKNGDGSAFVLNLEATKVTPTQSLAEKFTSIEATSGGNTASIKNLNEVIVGPTGGTARAVLNLDVNGFVSGTVATNNGTSSSFTIIASEFKVVSDVNGQSVVPFLIQGDKTYLKNVIVENITYGSLTPLFANEYSNMNPAAGFQKMPSGFIMQWGQYRSAGMSERGVDIVFPIPFPNALMTAQASAYIDIANQTNRDIWMQVTSNRDRTHQQFQAQANEGGNTIDGFDWIAYGY